MTEIKKTCDKFETDILLFRNLKNLGLEKFGVRSQKFDSKI